MIRSDLVLRIAARNRHLHDKDCEAIVSAILNCIADALVAGDRVELRDFGSFALTPREAREGRNPRTGAKVDVPAKVAVRFLPGKAMKQRVMGSSRPS